MAVSNSLFCQLAVFKNVVKSGNVTPNLLKRITSDLNNVRLYASAETAPAESQKASTNKPEKKMSKAMLAYLERARAHDVFIKKEEENYQIGKRHLANMMGENPEHFTQEDVQKAIEYLMPSGLFDKAARPTMQPPEKIFPPRKAAEFDVTGRPLHSMFYTTRPNYYQALHDIVEQRNIIKDLEDKNIREGIPPKPEDQMDTTSSDWIQQKDLEKILLETLTEQEYEYFISSINRLVNHPYSNHAKDLIMKFRRTKNILSQSLANLPLNYDSEGRPFVTVPDCMRKSARGVVTIRGKGSGKITVNGIPLIRYFPEPQEREQIIFPLQFAKMMDKVDIEAEVQYGGPTGQSGCIRWGIAWGLRAFVDKKMVEKMRIAGLLTRDWRRRERKKPGQEGARRKFTWKKR